MEISELQLVLITFILIALIAGIGITILVSMQTNSIGYTTRTLITASANAITNSGK